MCSRAAAVAALWGGLALVVVPLYPGFVSPNELSRWAAVVSLVDRGSLAVPPDVAALLGPRFEDLAEMDGRLYPNKAPGAALVALPGYLLVRAFSGPPSAGSMRLAVTAMRVAAATLPVLLLAFGFARVARRGGAPEASITASLLALLFGTPLLAYGLLLFAHALTAACLFGAWAFLFLPGGEDGEGERPRELLAGALLGLAVISEYPVAVPAAALFLLATWGRPVPRLARIVAGALPFVLLLGLSNTLSFGSPLSFSSGHERAEAFRNLAARGVFGVGLPSPGIVLSLLLDPSKGLLVLSPFLVLFPLALRAARERLGGRATAALLAVPITLLLTYGGYPNWHGGFTVGARYLVAGLPFLVFPFVFVRQGPGLAALAGASVAAVATVSLVFPFVPPGFPLPWGSFAAPLLVRGLVVPNLLHLVFRPAALVVPFLLVLAAVLAGLPARRLPAFAAGAGLWLAAGLLLPRLSPLPPPLLVQRGYVEDVYFCRPGALERSLPVGVSVPARLTERRNLERTLPPPPWPF